jgi:hypothetical protein
MDDPFDRAHLRVLLGVESAPFAAELLEVR